ncbi:hypothetical protein Tco_1177864 [Tanacetum coccineum]
MHDCGVLMGSGALVLGFRVRVWVVHSTDMGGVLSRVSWSAGSWVMGEGIGLLGKNTSMINMSESYLAAIFKNTDGSDRAQSKVVNALRGVNMEAGVDGCCNGTRHDDAGMSLSVTEKANDGVVYRMDTRFVNVAVISLLGFCRNRVLMYHHYGYNNLVSPIWKCGNAC